jgi:tetratricopeptide (TPR) repeat protein
MGPPVFFEAELLRGRAEARLGLGRTEEAIADAERALAIVAEDGSSQSALANTRLVLARALWGRKADRARAHALAEAARDTYREAGDAHADELATVDRWLATHHIRRPK